MIVIIKAKSTKRYMIFGHYLIENSFDKVTQK